MNPALERDGLKIILFGVPEDDYSFERKHGGCRCAANAFRASGRQTTTEREHNGKCGKTHQQFIPMKHDKQKDWLRASGKQKPHWNWQRVRESEAIRLFWLGCLRTGLNRRSVFFGNFVLPFP